MQPLTSSEPLLVENVDSILSTFSAHGLKDLSKSALMNRVDSKFLLPRGQLPALLQHCQQFYSVLSIDGIRQFQYLSSYYDTEALDFFHQHHKGKLNRIKVRHRNYVDTATSFVELKFKNNKGRTVKTRTPVCGEPSVALMQANHFLRGENVPQPSGLQVVQLGSYNRISLANEVVGERITIDSDMAFCDALTGQRVELNDTVIIELKQQRHDRRSPVYQYMRSKSVRPRSFSKYCMGMALTSSKRVKTNRFKANLLQLNKLQQANY